MKARAQITQVPLAATVRKLYGAELILKGITARGAEASILSSRIFTGAHLEITTTSVAGILPLLPQEGGEGWGEEGHLAYDWYWCKQHCAPLPSPLPARSSRGEGGRRFAWSGGPVDVQP